MTKKLFILGFIAILAFTACQNKKTNTDKTTNDSTQVSAKVDSSLIVKTTLTDNSGKKLDLTFDNNNSTLTFIWEGETITLKQDTMASGIQYSNKTYTYTEWHGESDLKKNDKVIFTNH